MAADWARYLHENGDVYNMYSDGGKWSWANGRKQGAYQREDGSMLQQESAAQYAQNHYNNFGKREGRKVHEQGSTDYAAKLGGGGGGGGNSELNAELAAMIKSLAEIAQDPNATAEQKAEAAEKSKTILTNFGGTDDDKKKSFLTPLGG